MDRFSRQRLREAVIFSEGEPKGHGRASRHVTRPAHRYFVLGLTTGSIAPVTQGTINERAWDPVGLSYYSTGLTTTVVNPSTTITIASGALVGATWGNGSFHVTQLFC